MYNKKTTKFYNTGSTYWKFVSCTNKGTALFTRLCRERDICRHLRNMFFIYNRKINHRYPVRIIKIYLHICMWTHVCICKIYTHFIINYDQHVYTSPFCVFFFPVIFPLSFPYYLELSDPSYFIKITKVS